MSPPNSGKSSLLQPMGLMPGCTLIDSGLRSVPPPGSQFDHAAAARRFRGGIGKCQRADPLFGADQRRRTARNSRNEMIELAAIRFGIALQEKGQRLVADHTLG